MEGNAAKNFNVTNETISLGNDFSQTVFEGGNKSNDVDLLSFLMQTCHH